MKAQFIVLFLLSGFSLFAQSVETRSVPNFNQLNAGGSWDVILKKGDQNEVRLEAKDLNLEKVITEVKGGILNIQLEKGNYRNVDLEVTVTYQELEAVHSSGSGNLKSMDPLVADELKLSLSGSGNASFNRVTADKLDLTMTGSGDLIIREGSVGEATLKQSGSGNLKAVDLEAEDVQVQKSGSGNATLTVGRTLSVRSSGSGNVEYKGNPSLNDIKISGSGRVLKR